MKQFKIQFDGTIKTPFSVPVSYKELSNKIGFCVMPDDQNGLIELEQEIQEEDYLFFIVTPHNKLAGILITDELPYRVATPITVRSVSGR